MPPVNTQNLLNVARELLISPRKNEQHFRSSTSRAYYSVFHECSKTAIAKLNTLPSNGMGSSFKHHELCDVFNNHNQNINITQRDRDIWKIGALLRQIKDLRVDADYRDNATYTHAHASDAIQYAEAIMLLLPTI